MTKNDRENLVLNTVMSHLVALREGNSIPFAGAAWSIQEAVNRVPDDGVQMHALIDTVGAYLDALIELADAAAHPVEVGADVVDGQRRLAVDDISKLLEQFPQHLRVADVLAVLRGVDDFSGSGHAGAPQIDPVGGVDDVGAPNPTHGFPHEGGAQ